MSEIHAAILENFETYVTENQKFVVKGNKSAGTRARKALMELTRLAKSRRAEIQDEKNSEGDEE